MNTKTKMLGNRATKIGHSAMGKCALTTLVALGSLSATVDGAAAVLTFDSGPINVAVPDDDSSGLASVIQVSGQNDLISDLKVRLNLTADQGAGFNGDLYAYLSHDTIDGFTVLLNRPGRTSSNPIGTDGSGLSPVTFEDEAANGDVHLYEHTLGTAFNAGDPLTGTWQPDGRNVDPAVALDTDSRTAFLSSFNGQAPNGEWTLFVADVASGGVVTLSDWGLDITVTTVPEPHHALWLGLGLGYFAFRQRRSPRRNPAVSEA